MYLARKPEKLFEQVYLEMPFSPKSKKAHAVVVEARRFAPSVAFPEGDAYVSIQSGGESVCIAERHLGPVILAMLQAYEGLGVRTKTPVKKRRSQARP